VERFGFVGLPNAGKSSLYNALTGGGALAAPYAFATTEPNIGVARVPDDRLGRLAEMSASRKVVPTSVEFADIGGLVEGASQGEGLGNKFLAGIREVDAIVFVLRAFRDSDVPGPTDPLEHLRVVEVELALADLETCEKQVDKLRRTAKGDPSLRPAVAALDRAVGLLGEATFGVAQGFSDVVGLFVGTGLGGALILDGRLRRGFRWSAGEVGHAYLYWPGKSFEVLCSKARDCMSGLDEKAGVLIDDHAPWLASALQP
jgi:hypothetical protein